MRNTFVVLMVCSLWQAGLGTLIATLVMRGGISYRRFYWLSDDFAVYVPFSLAVLLWIPLHNYASFIDLTTGLYFFN